MTPTELLELFRLELDDTAQPYLWSEQEFYTYLNEAQYTFVREMGGFADRRSAMTKLNYKAGDQYKKYDPRILYIKGAFDENNKVVTVRNLDNFAGPYFEDDYGMQSLEGLDDSRTGPIRYLITDVEEQTIQLYPIPEADGYIRLFVYRYPEDKIEGSSSEIELPEQHHLCLLNWVKYKALLKQDAETFDALKAAAFRQAFDMAVVQAKKEKSSREDRKRTVRFSW